MSLEAIKTIRCIDCGDILILGDRDNEKGDYLCGYCISRAKARSIEARRAIIK